ncbi:hypothetical protein ACN6AT_37110 (plasmid) [Streptomyces sp. JL4002]|uniref:hypothetical protein n=1 Tax=Streptomyces sp. JL4002 TaxID=3404781 RepID=UPI003B27E384
MREGLKDDSYVGTMVGSALYVSPDPAVDSSFRLAAVQSMRYAQALADSKYSPKTDTMDWFDTYARLGLFYGGWTVSAGDWNTWQENQQSFTIPKAIIEILEQVLVAAEDDGATITSAVQNAIKALQADNGSIVAYNSKTNDDNGGHFLVNFPQVVDGYPTLTCVAFYFASKQTAKNYLVVEYDKETTTVMYARWDTIFDPEAYAEVSATIEEAANKLKAEPSPTNL